VSKNPKLDKINSTSQISLFFSETVMLYLTYTSKHGLLPKKDGCYNCMGVDTYAKMKLYFTVLFHPWVDLPLLGGIFN